MGDDEQCTAAEDQDWRGNSLTCLMFVACVATSSFPLSSRRNNFTRRTHNGSMETRSQNSLIIMSNRV
ncbi:hypothetical protein BJ165DRAFT_928678 [Panaeolus papilionaceus]|nr:hypothetical protein BJ165DRAFT_928678 [Panaeolus papilionaceus]